MIAALYVQTNGCYYGLPDVDPWDKARDARLYDGPWPVVAHPPCSAWCRLAGVIEARWGHRRGEDDGCFAAALASVRKWGGVLEHPAYSDAWTAFDLPHPPTDRYGWQRGICGGWSAHVEQANYGHPARQATWLYAFGAEPPQAIWRPSEPTAWVSWMANHNHGKSMRRIGKREAARTPIEFRDLLLSIARTAKPREQAA